MAAPTKLVNINLLPEDELDSTTRGRVLRWLLGTFRYLVIATELIVVLAFISRFYFDSKIADLNDEIQQKSDTILSSADFEKHFRQTQQKLAIFSQMAKSTEAVTPLMINVISRLPSDTALTGIVLTADNQADINGTSLSEKSIQQFLVNLAASQYFSNVSLSQVETKQDQANITFSITATLKGGSK